MDEKSFNDIDPIVYLMNDPGTPDLWKKVPIEKPQTPICSIRGWEGGGFDLNTKQGRAAQAYVVINETMKWVYQAAPRKLNKWAATTMLKVDPEAGEDLNAYYYRQGMKFFYYGDMYTSMSSDIVAHELGHAIFDSYRPESWNLASLESWSFHEAFADITAILTALQNEEVIAFLLKDNYLYYDNLVSRVGEQIGKVIHNITKGQDGRNPNYLRNAAVHWNYVVPSTLPKKGNHDQLVAEEHSFGRVLLSAFYAIFYKVYEYYVLRAYPQAEALKLSRDFLSKCLMEAMMICPMNARFFQSFARSMMHIALQEKEDLHKIVQNIFRERKIIPSIQALSHIDIDENKIEDGLVKEGFVETTRMVDEIEIGTLNHNPLYDLEIEIPVESTYFTAAGKVIDMAVGNRAEAIVAAKLSLDLLHENNLVGSDDKTPFDVQGNKLVRTHFID